MEFDGRRRWAECAGENQLRALRWDSVFPTRFQNSRGLRILPPHHTVYVVVRQPRWQDIQQLIDEFKLFVRVSQL